MPAVPDYVAANARRGLDLLEFAGSGLRPKTVREARQMAGGSISNDKVMRMAAWLARHESDLNSDRARAYLAGDSERPTPGQVAWLLWGGDIGAANRGRAKAWADKVTERLRESGELDKEVSGRVRAALQAKVDEHNEKYTASSKRVTLAMLSAVFERGVGAYNTNPASVRPTVTSSDQWAYARVNTFLSAVRNGRFPGKAFDTDLLPEGHPLSTRD